MPDRRIQVIKFRPADRAFYYCQWTDPATGRKRTRSSGCKRERDAERFRSKLEDEVNAGEIGDRHKTTWEDFRKRVERDFLPEKRESTRLGYAGAMNAVEELLAPKLVSAIDGEAIDTLKAKLREKGLKGKPIRETTIASYLRHIKALLRWGHRRKLIRAVPAIDMPRHTKVAGGRPITEAEFEKVLAAAPGVVGDERAASWQHLLRGLWTSGLRIGEAARLTWDDPALPRVDIDRPRPMLLIPAAHQKAGRDTITPIVPEFLALLRETPPEARTGFVFNPRAARVVGPRLTQDAMQHVIADIGRKSGVRVRADRESYVSAHDLRRSF
ncbi:MAG TPA: tyrosine-type recombinase/integrase, partial [Planctomycetaceae bacterium]